MCWHSASCRKQSSKVPMVFCTSSENLREHRTTSKTHIDKKNCKKQRSRKICYHIGSQGRFLLHSGILQSWRLQGCDPGHCLGSLFVQAFNELLKVILCLCQHRSQRGRSTINTWLGTIRRSQVHQLFRFHLLWCWHLLWVHTFNSLPALQITFADTHRFLRLHKVFHHILIIFEIPSGATKLVKQACSNNPSL